MAEGNLYRMGAMACMAVFLLTTSVVSTALWMKLLFFTSAVVMFFVGLMLWSEARQYGSLGEGGPMVVSMLFGVLPVMHLGHKLVLWGILGAVVVMISRLAHIQTEWTVFYFAITIIILSIFQWQMDRLMRIQYQAERVEREKAETDQLTGTLNRHAFEQRMTGLLSGFRPGQGVALCMIDIDHFKAYNDHYGHLQGDLALVAVAKALNDLPADLVVRFGGEEFILVVMYERRPPSWLHDVTARISAMNIAHEASPLGRVTISIGIADFVQTPKARPISVKTLLTQADEQLYQAKLSGRNQYAHVNLNETPGLTKLAVSTIPKQ